MYTTQVDGGAHVVGFGSVGFGSVGVGGDSGRTLRFSFSLDDPVIGMTNWFRGRSMEGCGVEVCNRLGVDVVWRTVYGALFSGEGRVVGVELLINGLASKNGKIK